MVDYVILGTSHPDPQDSAKFGKPVTEAIQKHSVRLVAEEHPLDTISAACVVTKHLHIPYLQVDLFHQEWRDHEVDREMGFRGRCCHGQDIRLSHADSIREEFWLEKIKASLDHGRVLVICGYLHVDFLAQKMQDRGHRVVEKTFFPENLLSRKPEKILDETELRELIRKDRESSL